MRVQLKYVGSKNEQLLCVLCRCLKNCMWQANKKKEMEERKLVQVLYTDLVDMCKLNKVNKKVSKHTLNKKLSYRTVGKHMAE